MAWGLKTIQELLKGARRADEATAEKLRDPIADGKDAIRDATAEVDAHTKKVTELIADNNMIAGQLELAKKDVAKYENLAQMAGAAGNADDVRTALEEKAKAQKNADALTEAVNKNNQMIANLKSEISAARDRIATAKTDQVQLAAVITGSKIRQGLAEASTALGSKDSALGRLGKLKEDSMKVEAQAAAAEEMAGVSAPGTALEQKYAQPAVSDDDVSKYLKKQ